MRRSALILTALAVVAAVPLLAARADAAGDFVILPGGSAPAAKAAARPDAGTTGRLLVRFTPAAVAPTGNGPLGLNRSGGPATHGTWGDTGAAVAKTLRDKAAETQGRALDLVQGARASATPFWISNTLVVEGADATLQSQLAQLPGVIEVRPERRYKMVKPVNAKQVLAAASTMAAPAWGVSKIGADKAWDQGVMGGGVVVATIDSGVDYTHPALAAQYRGNLGNGTFDHNYNWLDVSRTCATAAPCDLDGHGTHTLGTIVGGDGPGPFTPDIGVAPAARWISAGCGPSFCDESQVMTAGQWIVAPYGDATHPADPAKRPHIVSNSWGGPGGDPTMQDMVRAWRAAGIIPVFSSGNEGPDCGTVGSPGDYPEAFTVGGTAPDDAIAPFSSRGPSRAGTAKPQVVAPAVDIVSSVPGGEYTPMSGTSMAAPHAAGALALMLSAAPELRGNATKATDALTRTALPHPEAACGGDAAGSPNNAYGAGRIDAAAAVGAVASGGRVTGRITAAADGTAVGGARLRMAGGAGEFSAISRADGTYAVLVPPGTYKVSAEGFWFQSASRDGVAVTAGADTPVAIALVAAPLHTVSGTAVRAESGQALDAVKVSAVGTPAPAATTDAAGRYSLRLPGGAYTLIARRGGCTAPATAPAAMSGAGDATADFRLMAKTAKFGYGCAPSTTTWQATSTATKLTGDSAYGKFSLPFAFPFFGKSYRTAYVTTEGVVSFVDPLYAEAFNTDLPAQELPNAAVYPLWQDLRVEGDASITYGSFGFWTNRRTVITFDKMRINGSDATVSFQVHLWANGAVDVLYRDTGGVVDGGSATVGIENEAGTDALAFSFRERVLSSDSAWRFSQVATAKASGTVVDANDGRAVAGATVTAEPGGRRVTADAQGRYTLPLVPGTYKITATGPRYGSVTSPDVTVRANATASVGALRVPAPVATVSPASLNLSTPSGQAKEGTVTVTNTGTAPLHWSAFDREATTAAVPPVPLVTDPADDGTGSVDLVGLSAGSNGRTLSGVVQFSPTTPMSATVGLVLVDVDQNPATGVPATSQGGSATQDLGVEYVILLTPLQFGTNQVQIIRASDNQPLAMAPGKIEGQTMSFQVPVSQFGLGEDGSVDVAAMVGSYMGATDWAPNVGHATVEAGRDPAWLAVTSPPSGTLAPGASVTLTVQGGGPGVPRGSFSGELRLVTDAPRNSKVSVPVRLSVS